MKKNIFALDLGTTKFCLGKIDFQSEQKIDLVAVPAMGMHRGMVSGFEAAKASLIELLHAAEDRFQTDILSVAVGVAGAHLRSEVIRTSYDLEGRRVEGELLDELYQKSKLDIRSPSRENMHFIPVGYQIDDRKFQDEPIGFRGSKLHLEFLKIDGDQYYLQDVMSLCNEAGLKVERFIAEPVASASVTLSEEHKDLGTVMLDIGGGTSDGILFKGKRPIKIFTLDIGGKMITRDLCLGLGIKEESAESLKRMAGLDLTKRSQTFVGSGLDDTSCQVDFARIYQILAPRAMEMAEKINAELGPYKSYLGTGLVLTGGGSLIPGLDLIFAKLLGMRVQRLQPSILGKTDDAKVFPEKYATCLGMLNLQLAAAQKNKFNNKMGTSGYFSKFVNWIKELT
jgi:cell division protein FtsA